MYTNIFFTLSVLLIQFTGYSNAQIGDPIGDLLGGLIGGVANGFQGYVTTVFGRVSTVTSVTAIYSTVPAAPAYTNIYCSVTTTSGQSQLTNQGLEYAYYYEVPSDNTVQVSNGTNGYPSYDPTYYDNIIPDYIGQTYYIGFATVADYNDPNYKYYPDSPPHSVVDTTLIHRGYLYARTSGNYAFINAYIDDIVLTWTGQPAAEGYTRANAQLVDTYTRPPQTDRGFSVFLTAGTYYPIRIQYTNAEQAAGLQYFIFNPDGLTLLSQAVSVDIVTQPCDVSQVPTNQRFAAIYQGQYTTVTYVGTDTTTSRTTVATAQGSSTGTIAVYLPPATAYTTITTLQPGGATTTLTSTLATPSGTVIGTVEVFVPPNYVTVTSLNPDPAATQTITNTISPTDLNNPGTVQVLIPPTYVTITSLNNDPNAVGTQTTTIALPQGTTPGTVEILTPAGYVTITAPYTGTDTLAQPITTTIASPNGGNPGTVEVLINAVYATRTLPYTGSGNLPGPITITGVPASGNNPGTVFVYTPTTTSTTSNRPTLATMLGQASCVCLPS